MVFQREEFIKSIFQISSAQEFNELALKLFHYQAEHLLAYREFLSLIQTHPSDITSKEEIPFLPIRFFKDRSLLISEKKAETIFRSSGTTSAQTSEHHVADLKLYEHSFTTYFEMVYDQCSELEILALLPSYLERSDSSLVYMVNSLIERTESEHSGFYLQNYQELLAKIKELQQKSKPIILFGVTFALLDIATHYPNTNWDSLTIIETGGMKGRGKELTRAELHHELYSKLNPDHIHSEYGMTELLSQAYSSGDIFTPPPWMKISTREIDDPFSTQEFNKTGGINIIDLANVDSCAFIATDDLGQVDDAGRFKVLGRFDHSDVRGCNLMVQNY
ncbi:MAG: acyl transferase [Flavobacteriales bacterium]